MRKIVVINQDEAIPANGKYLTSVTINQPKNFKIIFFYEVDIDYKPIKINNGYFNPKIGEA